MGYSISVPLRSTRAYDVCLAFLREHGRPWSQVRPPMAAQGAVGFNTDLNWTTNIVSGSDLSADRVKNRVGFNCGLSDGLSDEYALTLLRFCALRWGRVRPLRSFTGTHDSVPYIVYEGHEAWAVLRRSEWEDQVPPESWWCLVDDLGCRRWRRPWEGPWNPALAPRAVLVDADALLASPEARKLLLNLGVSEEEVAGFDGEIICDPIQVNRVHAKLVSLGLDAKIDLGPIVLHGWRKEAANDMEATYQACEEAVRAEMLRLDTRLGRRVPA